jgi:hypothetical protein
LRSTPHRLTGEALRAAIALLQSYQLRTVEQLRQSKPQPNDQCLALTHLAYYKGLRYLQPACGFGTRHISKIRAHVAAQHKIKAAAYCESQLLWQECQLQTYFIGKGCIDYFAVVGRAGARIEAEAETEAVIVSEQCE